MDRDNANATRLRVNRIGLIQQIDTEELIPKLIHCCIISAEHDVDYINQGTSKIDRARRLIDCLLDKEHSERPANWFLLFRSILLENSTAYEKLVTALDNTIIRQPDFTKHISEIPLNSEQEHITNIEFDPYSTNKILIEGSFQKVINNLTYYSQIPEDLIDQLSHSTQSYDQEQLHNEKEIFNQMHQLELMTDLIKKEKSYSKHNIFDTQIIDSILTNKLHQHYFYKYFYTLSSIYGVHYDQQFVQAFKRALSNENNVLKTIEKGLSGSHVIRWEREKILTRKEKYIELS